MLAAGAASEYVDVVESLVRGGAKPGIKNQSGHSALQKAVEKDHANIVRLLLNTGERLSTNELTDVFVFAAMGAHQEEH